MRALGRAGAIRDIRLSALHGVQQKDAASMLARPATQLTRLQLHEMEDFTVRTAKLGLHGREVPSGQGSCSDIPFCMAPKLAEAFLMFQHHWAGTLEKAL